MSPSRRYALADTAQQVVGGFLLAGPFVVTEEVWTLAAEMTLTQTAATVLIVLAVGYGALYKADDRDPDRERDLGGVPVRYLSLVGVAYLSVAVLALSLGAPGTFVPDGGTVERLLVTLRAVSVGAIFSVIGAATTDSLF
jgi:Predicted membrane protein